MGLTVKLNDVEYAIALRKARYLIKSALVPSFRPGFVVGGPPTLKDVEGAAEFLFADLSEGMGRARINSNSALKDSEYRRFWDSTLDTRRADGAYLPILAEDSSHSGLEVIRASESYKGNLWALWEDISGATVLSRKYDADATPNWAAGGRVSYPLFDASTDSTSDGFSHTVGTKGNRLLMVVVISVGVPSSITYGGVSMTSITNGTIPSGEVLSTWKLVAPASGGNTVTLTGESGLSAVQAISYYNVDQSTPTGTVDVTVGTGTSSAVTATGNGASLMFGVAAANATLTGAAGQTERENTFNSNGLASADKPGSGATTLTWTLSSVGHTSIAIPINSSAVVGLDIHAHKTHLLALCAAADGHVVTRSTDGVTFSLPSAQVTQGLLDNVVTAHEDIDAGLLGTIGDYAVAALWHESNGTITFFSSINAGDNWVDQDIDIASGGGPKGLATMTGTDGVKRLYVGTREGLHEVDVSLGSGNWTTNPIRPMLSDDNNCRRMAVGENGALWFAYGVDDNSIPIVYNLFTNGGVHDFRPVPNDFSVGDGLPAARLGPIRWMEPAQGDMYVAQGGGDESRNASVWCHNGKGWHSMRKHGTANKKIEWIAASGDDDGTPRLHYAIRTATATSDTWFLGQAFTNPTSAVAIKRELNGLVDLPSLDGGFPGESGAWQKVVINGDDLGTTSAEYFNVDYAPDGVARGGQNLGDFTSAVSTIKFPSTNGGSDFGKGYASVNMTLRINAIRDGSGSNPELETPVLKDVRLVVRKQPAKRKRTTMTIDIDETKALPAGRTPENILADIQTAIDLGTNNTFTWPPLITATYVEVADYELTPYFGEGAEGGSQPIGSGAQRSGFVALVLEELV